MPKKLRVLIIGSGGREHALYETIRRSSLVTRTFITPGNAGIPQKNCLTTKSDDFFELVRVARENGVDMVVVGPEQPLVGGIVDHFAEYAPEIKVFGPSKAAAQLEGSKVYCKKICTKYGIPTAEYRVATNEGEADLAVIAMGGECVVKADGLAGGKGVLVARGVVEAIAFARKQLASGHQVIVERKLEGQEVSVFALCDGKHAFMFGTARDYKRLYSGPSGAENPNTGGMGAYSPVLDVDDKLLSEIKKKIIDWLVAGMRAEGFPYRGMLYAGIMVTEGGPMLLEVNCRFGDPETQVILPRLTSDIVPYLVACCKEDGLATLPQPEWSDKHTVCLVLVPPEYPEESIVPRAIEGLEKAARRYRVKVFYADTHRGTLGTYTGDGRSLNTVGVAPTRDKARFRAYVAASDLRLSHDRFHYREDIGE